MKTQSITPRTDRADKNKAPRDALLRLCFELETEIFEIKEIAEVTHQTLHNVGKMIGGESVPPPPPLPWNEVDLFVVCFL